MPGFGQSNEPSIRLGEARTAKRIECLHVRVLHRDLVGRGRSVDHARRCSSRNRAETQTSGEADSPKRRGSDGSVQHDANQAGLVCTFHDLTGSRKYRMVSKVIVHISALQMFTTTARLLRAPFCSYSQAAIVALAPAQVIQVNSECWLESPL